jgi:hypothetical protein
MFPADRRSDGKEEFMKNKQTAIGLLVVLCLIFSLSACGRQVSNVADSAANAISAAGRSIGQLLEGDVTGEIGKDYSTRWFSFNVKSVIGFMTRCRRVPLHH